MGDVERLIKLGKELGLTGEQLRTWVDDKLEVEEVVRIGELCFAGFWKLQFVQVLKYKVLT